MLVVVVVRAGAAARRGRDDDPRSEHHGGVDQGPDRHVAAEEQSEQRDRKPIGFVTEELHQRMMPQNIVGSAQYCTTAISPSFGTLLLIREGRRRPRFSQTTQRGRDNWR